MTNKNQNKSDARMTVISETLKLVVLNVFFPNRASLAGNYLSYMPILLQFRQISPYKRTKIIHSSH